MTAFAPELAMSKMHRTVKEIKGARKERDRGRRRKARTSGAGWSSRDSLSLSAEEKYVPLRNGSKAPRVCFTTSYQRRGRWDTEEDQRCRERVKYIVPLIGWRFWPHVPSNFLMLMTI